MSETKNLMAGLIEEIQRVTIKIELWQRECPDVGAIAITMMHRDIRDAEKAIQTGDLPGMIAAYQTLKEWGDD